MGSRNIIGVTGGIACGKTLVCGLFEQLGVKIFDADEIARELVQPGQPALAKIVACFGTVVLNQDGSLNRSSLRQLIFANTELRKQLENILHPCIYARMQQLEAQFDNVDYCIFCVPLLIETQKTAMVRRVLVIDCDAAIQRQRLQYRDKINSQEIEAVLNAQVDRATRLAYADDVIQNNHGLDKLEKKIKTLHQYYLRLFNSAQRN